MRFERGGAEHDLAVDEVGRDAPLQPFLDFGHERVDALADMLEDRAREGLGLLDVGVDARIASHRMPCPSMRRMTPTTITNRLRLRPALLREIMPITAPMMASGTISQLSAPRNGMKATIAQSSATNPMISETRLNIAAAVSSFGRLRQLGRAQHRHHVQHQRGPDHREGNSVRDGDLLAVEEHADQELERR